MRVGVGSTNPVKRSATESALREFPGTSVESVAVESGVSEQPVGERETVEGAQNRARNVLDAADYDIGVGLEGGVAEIAAGAAGAETEVGEEVETDGFFLIMWAAATDGDRTGVGAGPRLRLPESIASRVRDGEELGPVMDDVLDMDDVAKKQGAAGALTGGIIDRETALRQAIAGAFGPFVTDLYE
ncbi:inosine/xanthosine triphosphatase [Halobacteriales archaeon SW_6_65_15]|jgi:inosine/xanthosine triphosphatase|nr:MAG: inosine/xanthosine triphosphatase [Halobacteriales archaeon SW_6_65_15]